MGDFNIVEEQIDRLPAHEDRHQAVEMLDRMKQYLHLRDSWREINPNTKMYTFYQKSTGSQSRIDRIYMTDQTSATAREWKAHPVGIPNTDHMMVSVKVTSEDAPWMGPGRRTIPMYIIRDEQVRNYIRTRGLEATKDLEDLGRSRAPHDNPQRILHAFKTDVRNCAIKRQRVKIPTLIQNITKTKKDLHETLNDERVPKEQRRTRAAKLAEQLDTLEKRRHNQIRTDIKVKNRIEGETICKGWCRLGKEKTPRDVIYALKKPNPAPDEQPHEKNSKKMAELAKTYHNDIQKNGIEPDGARRRECTETVLQNIETQPTEEQTEKLRQKISGDEVEDALRYSKKDSAAGIDGLTYEFWAEIDDQYHKDSQNEDIKAFNVIKLLTAAFNDIQRFGVDPTTDFAEGWMCPIFKKKERDNIANYRPITLLNTDYKLYTKALTLKLAQAAPTLIHKTQAGFIPGRQISEQTQLTHMVMEYAAMNDPSEDEIRDGIIVALDQEKAYDKIMHDYLWKTLERFGIPEEFIKSVRTLYENAETRVMINGFLSRPYKITRGVRQGDPLSCLLFDLAIEPLAASLRASTLIGFKIPGVTERLIATLFADDTTTYLSKDDSLADLNTYLDTWCAASGARFNKDKTEIIPIGQPEYQEMVRRTRTMTPDGERIPESVHIAQDGEAVRILGAWYGSNISEISVWTPTLEKIDQTLERWNKRNPTMEGRKHIVQMCIGGMTQYRTQVQGMPKSIEDRLQKRIRTFVWHDKTQSPVNAETLRAPINKGGRGLLDIKARNEAINIMWIKEYLKLTDDRPLWAYLADAILARNTPETETNVPDSTKINIFLQSWKTKSSAIPTKLRTMLKTAKMYGVRREGLAFSREIMRKIPIWYHGEADPKLRRITHSKASKCLRDNHQAYTVGDIEDVANTPLDDEHTGRRTCRCDSCEQMRTEDHCHNPDACVRRANELIEQLPMKWNPTKQQPRDVQEIEDRQDDLLDERASQQNNEDAIDRDDQVGPQPRNEGTGTPDHDDQAAPQPENRNDDAGSQTPNGSQDERTEPDDDDDEWEHPDWKTFNADITTDGTLADIFRVFTTGETCNTILIRDVPELMEDPIIIATDGSCSEINNSPQAGAGGYVEDQHELNFALRIQQDMKQTSQVGELVAAKEASTRAPTNRELGIISDSRHVETEVTKYRQVHEDQGYIGKENAPIIQAVIAALRTRTQKTKIRWVKGHSGHKLNEGADKLADSGARKDVPDAVDLTIPPELRLSGARLATLTQKLAYKGIRERSMNAYKGRERTKDNIIKAIDYIEIHFETSPTEARIWKGIRHKDLRREIRYFLWMTTHDAYMVGTNWLRPGYSEELQERHECRTCGVTESMDHILTECEIPGQKEVWELAEAAWKKKQKQWNTPLLGGIISNACASFKSEDGKKLPGVSRLYRILISESAYLIWKLRNARVIQSENGEVPSREEIRNKWIHAMNDRLAVDCKMTNKRKYGKKAVKEDLVRDTWTGIIKNERYLPYDWTRGKVEVLVGIDYG